MASVVLKLFAELGFLEYLHFQRASAFGYSLGDTEHTNPLDRSPGIKL